MSTAGQSRKSSVRVGSLKRIVEIQEKTRTPDGAGGYEVTWTTVDTVGASVDPVGGSEVTRAEQLRYPITHVVFMRFRTDITINGDRRLYYDGRAFNIRNVYDINEDRRFIRLLVEENVAQ